MTSSNGATSTTPEATQIKTTEPQLPVVLTWQTKVEQLTKWILGGASEHDIAEAVQASWPADDHQQMMVEALATLAKSAHFDADLLTGFCVEATRDLYRRMVEIGDFTGALRALKQLHDFAKHHVCDQETTSDDQTHTVDAATTGIPATTSKTIRRQRRRDSATNPGPKKKTREPRKKR
jgi:hypothetical protein